MSLLSDEQGTSSVIMSLHMSAMSLGSLLSGIYIARIVKRIGRGNSLRVASAMIIIGILALYFLPTYILTLSSAFFIGLATTILVTMNTAFIDQEHHHAAPVALSELNMFAAATGFISPLAVGWFVSAGLGWRTGGLVLICALVAVEFFRRDVSAFDVQRGEEVQEHTGKLPRDYWWTWSLLIITSGAEFCLMLFSTDLLRDSGGMGDAAAVASVSTLSLGLLVGRILIARISRTIDAEMLLRATFVFTFAAFWLLWAMPQPAVMLTGLFLCGVGIAGHWPLSIARTIRAGGNKPDLAAAKTALATGGSGILIPLALGAVAEFVGVHTAFLQVPALLAIGLGVLMAHPLGALKR
jgi:predicted MFS family arabinose efflux permease